MESSDGALTDATTAATLAGTRLAALQQQSVDWRTGNLPGKLNATGLPKLQKTKEAAQSTRDAAVRLIEETYTSQTSAARTTLTVKLAATNAECSAFQDEVDKERQMIASYRHRVLHYAHTAVVTPPSNPWCDRDLRGPDPGTAASPGSTAGQGCCKMQNMATCAICLGYSNGNITADLGTLRKFCSHTTAAGDNCNYDGCATCSSKCRSTLPLLVNEKVDLNEKEAMKIFNQSTPGCKEEKHAHEAAKAHKAGWVQLNSSWTSTRDQLATAKATCVSLCPTADTSTTECTACKDSENKTQAAFNTLDVQLKAKQDVTQIEKLVAVALRNWQTCCNQTGGTTTGCPVAGFRR